MKVRITPKSQRAKNRVREHGEVMQLIREENGKTLFHSLNDTWRLSKDKMMPWGGWFSLEDASWEPIKED